MATFSRLIGSTSVIALAAFASMSHGNVIVNGDFQTGNLAPSTSAYSQNASMAPEATWNIVSFDTLNDNWVDFFDHTTGNADGRFMIVNGSTTPIGPAWAQVVSVTPGTTYEASAWFASLFAASISTVQFEVRDSVTNTVIFSPAPITAPSTLATWQRSNWTFDVGSSSQVILELRDINLASFGNDFALDDISMVVVPTPASLSAAAIASLFVMRRRRS
jgi:hypothetical protein